MNAGSTREYDTIAGPRQKEAMGALIEGLETLEAGDPVASWSMVAIITVCTNIK